MIFVIRARFLFGLEEKIELDYPKISGLYDQACSGVRKRNRELHWWNKVTSADVYEDGENGDMVFSLPSEGFAKGVKFNT